MELKPYWASPEIKKTGLAECISSYPSQPIGKILETKRKAANKTGREILKRDPEVDIAALIGSVAHGDIIGWFSDIDMLVITKEPRGEEMLEVDHEVLFIEYYSWKGFEELLTKRIARDEYEERSSCLFFYGKPRYLHSSGKAEKKYNGIVELRTEALWKDYSEIDEYLDDFIRFYGSAKEASRQSRPLTAIGKLQRGTVLLLRYYLIKYKILLRKPFPDDRTFVQLRKSQVPEKLVEFIEEMYKANLDITTMLRHARKMYLQITHRRKWRNQIPL
jgi:predicted nucleotidyltransferase